MRFVDALAFNWIIAGTDAHAKNYSLLLDPDETVERVDALAARVPDCFRRAMREAEVVALNSDLPGRLAERVAARADHCRKVLAG